MIEKVRLVPAKSRIWLGCVACILLVGLGFMRVQNGDKLGWFIIILFGLGVFAPGHLLLGGATWLELDEDGFTLCLSFRPDRYVWNHISEMAIWQGVVSFKLLPEHRGNKRGQSMARALSGHDGSIPDIFSLPPPSLLELMVKFKQNAQAQETSLITTLDRDTHRP
jgi:hypothetical protein